MSVLQKLGSFIFSVMLGPGYRWRVPSSGSALVQEGTASRTAAAAAAAAVGSRLLAKGLQPETIR